MRHAFMTDSRHKFAKDDFQDALEAAGQSVLGDDADLGFVLGPSEVAHLESMAIQAALPRVPDLWSSELYTGRGDISRRYAEEHVPETKRELRRQTDRFSIAAELNLRAGMPRDEIYRIRREFALSNHPDLFDSGLREIATRRMTIANMLIDEELRKRD